MNKSDFEKEEETREYQYIYFIENHIQTAHIIIELSKNQIIVDNLECVKKERKEINLKDIYIYSIYRFRFYSSRIKEIDSEIKENLSKLKVNMPKHWDIQIKKEEVKNFDIIIELTNEKNVKFEKIINIKDFVNDIFIFDFKFDNIYNDLLIDEDSPKSYSFSIEEQFLIYIDFLRNGYMKIKQKSRQNYGLILSIQQLLEENEKKFKFTFFFEYFIRMLCNSSCSRTFTLF